MIVEYEFVQQFYEKLSFQNNTTIEDGQYQVFEIKTKNSHQTITIPLSFPRFILHVGVSAATTHVLLEQRAINQTEGKDVFGNMNNSGKVNPSLPVHFYYCNPLSMIWIQYRFILHDEIS